MDRNLLPSDYESIATRVKRLSQEIQNIQRKHDFIGGIDDTPLFRKQLTAQIQETSRLVMSIKNQLESMKESVVFNNKWKKLESAFLSNYERLRAITNKVKTQFHTKETNSRKESSTSGDFLLASSHANGYGSAAENQQDQEIVFKPYDETQELENFEQQLYQILENLQELFEGQVDLNEMINDQQSGINLLQDNVVEAKDNVQSGVKHLDKAAQHQRAYRGKMCTFLAVLVVIAVIVTLIVVLSSNRHK
eukprot:CAMPEP_0202686522 /NCGR_PEP_ID=MMETSP1385-20130828/2274_1 /ASSEMBLY_ACC=CAM_ASM_000861 /TAXON_ID=933848 /ORGANISM="Elphidium margaritaceum" /LENGTH=249 /DNA_ID=CAMNT_0049341111 /DNA_START=55 /DNA_END=804 /DNA_ORIENTATION=+